VETFDDAQFEDAQQVPDQVIAEHVTGSPLLRYSNKESPISALTAVTLLFNKTVGTSEDTRASFPSKLRGVPPSTKGEETGVRNPGGVEFVQKAYQNDEDADQLHAADNNFAARIWSSIAGAFQSTFPSDEHSRTGTDGDSLLREILMVDSSSKSSTHGTSSFSATLLRSSVENGEFQAANERLKQGFDRCLFQSCCKGDTAADARIQELEQELHILEEELINESELLWEKDEKLYVDAVDKTTREATAKASGTYRA
jgi:hypothetical protein